MTKKPALSPAAKEILDWGVPRLIGAGYGLFSKKAANPRWPEFFITAFVLKKYRLKSSFWFMLRHGARGMRKHQIVAGEAKVILAKLIGSNPRQLYQLSGIYRGLRDEKGAAVATAAIVEIIRIANQKRKGRNKTYESNSNKTSRRRRRASHRRVAGPKTRHK